MGSLSLRSRYLAHPTVYRDIYTDEETNLEAKPIRRDVVFARRYTSFTFVDNDEYSEYVTQAGDTLPGLATKFYKNPQLWWVLADYNVDVLFYPLTLPANIVLIIPPTSLVGLVPSRF